MEKNLISSEKVSGKTHTFFLDLKRAKNGQPYLVVTESRKAKDKEGEFERSRIVLFKEETDAFRAALDRMFEQMRETAQA